MDARVAAWLSAYEGSDEEAVDRLFALILRRPPEAEARDRAIQKLATGTLSRAALVDELATAAEVRRVRELDDAVELGLGAAARGERLTWLQAPSGTDERVIEIPWVLSRLRPGLLLDVGYANAEPAYVAALLRSDVDVVGVDLVTRDVDGMEVVQGDVRSLPFADHTFSQVVCVSTLEHVGADNTVYGVEQETDEQGRLRALRELARVLRPGGTVIVTAPLGTPGDHGWFRLDDVRGWSRLFARAGLFVEEQEAYELKPEGWRPAPGFRPDDVGYGDRGPAASAVLCSELSHGRLRRLLTPGGLSRAARRRAREMRYRNDS